MPSVILSAMPSVMGIVLMLGPGGWRQVKLLLLGDSIMDALRVPLQKYRLAMLKRQKADPSVPACAQPPGVDNWQTAQIYSGPKCDWLPFPFAIRCVCKCGCGPSMPPFHSIATRGAKLSMRSMRLLIHVPSNSGDSTQHLLWRLRNGGLPPAARWRPRVVALLIGTNNLGNPLPPQEAAIHSGEDMTVDATVAGVAAIAAEIREWLPASRLLLQAVLPRTDKGYRSAGAISPAKWKEDITAVRSKPGYSRTRSRSKQPQIHTATGRSAPIVQCPHACSSFIALLRRKTVKRRADKDGRWRGEWERPRCCLPACQDVYVHQPDHLDRCGATAGDPLC